MQCARITVPRPMQQQVVQQNKLARILVHDVDILPASKAESGVDKSRPGKKDHIQQAKKPSKSDQTPAAHSQKH